MCGIGGIVHRGEALGPPSVELLGSMAHVMRHRGPDEFGIYRDDVAGLVHSRLSIIDIETGQQPMSNEDGTIWIIFNGEIFNYVELRKQLRALGHRFRTNSDTEVIVHAFESWGQDCFRRFNGDWAVALWDKRSRKLILSRDRIGVRPLYIHEDKNCIRFASEVKAIFVDSNVHRELDLRGLDQTFTYWSPLAPVSLFRDIEELPPASVRVYDRQGQKRETRFWEPIYPTMNRWDEARSEPTLSDATEILREKLERATELRMLRSDVPVGSYLSGGLDSSLVAWMGNKTKLGDLRTFSIRFEDSEFDETEYQRLMTSALGSNHTELLISQHDVAKAFSDVIWHTERPILRTAPVPMFLLSQEVQKAGIKAVLTGEGADEMLAGYDIFREAKIRLFWSRQPSSKVRPRLFDRLYEYLGRSPQQTKGIAFEFWRRGLDRAGKPGFSHDPRWTTTSSIKRFYSPDVRTALQADPAPSALAELPTEFTNWDSLSQAQFLELRTLLSSYLISSQGDRMLMAHSVEGRFPFLDVGVMEFCNSLPADYKLRILDEKHLLKRVARGKIPEPIIERKKQAFRAPDAISFVGPNAPGYVGDLLSEGSLRAAGLFDPKSVNGLYNKCLMFAKKSEGIPFGNTDNMAIVGILSTQLLYHDFVQKSVTTDRVPMSFKTFIDHAKSKEAYSDLKSGPINE